MRMLVRTMSNYSGPREKSLNMVQLLGRVGAAPVVRGDGGNKFVTFDMATNKYFQETGGAEDQITTKTQWHKIAVYKPFLVEKVEAYLKRGSRVMVIGSLESVDYNTADGKKAISTRIVTDDVIMLSTGS